MLNLRGVRGFDYQKFDTYAELVNMFLTSSIHDDPRVVTHDLGLASDGNTVYGFSIGDLEKKPVLYIQGQIHGRHEWRCSHWVFRFFELVVKGEELNKHLINQLLTRFSLFIIPCLNPYGYENYSYANANGVNINRNYDHNWEEFVNDNSYYNSTKGEYPFSEPETQIVKWVIETYKPIMMLDTHTRGGQTIPSIYPGSIEQPKWHYPFFRDIATSFRITAGVNGVGFIAPSDRPQSDTWGSMQMSRYGFPMISSSVEAPELVSDFEQAKQGIALLWVCTNYAMRFFENRNMRQA